MSECTYMVCIADGEVVLARGMSLSIALLLVEAMFQKYSNEPNAYYEIVREAEEGQ